jgi:hypothetical protein
MLIIGVPVQVETGAVLEQLQQMRCTPFFVLGTTFLFLS